MKKLAITGGLSCGKSTVCQAFRSFSAHCVSADELVHRLLTPNTEIGKQVLNLLGQNILDEKGTFNRKAIAKKVFTSPEKLKTLEAILHPKVMEEIQRDFLALSKSGNASLFIAEVPLLFEGKYEGEFDASIAVIAEKELCLRRFISAKKGSEEDFETRCQCQMTPEQKASLADFVITNNGNLSHLNEQVQKIYQNFI